MFLVTKVPINVAYFLNHCVKEVFASINELTDACEYDFDLTSALETLEKLDSPLNPYNASDYKIETENTLRYSNEYTIDSINNFQEKSDNVSFSFNNPHDDNSNYLNSMIQYSTDNYPNNQEHSDEDLPTFTTLEPKKYSELQLPACANEVGNINSIDTKNDVDNLDILNLAYESVFPKDENDEIIILRSDKKPNKSRNIKRKRSKNDNCQTRVQKYSRASNILRSPRVQNRSKKASKQDSDFINANKRSNSVTEPNKKLQNLNNSLNMLKTYEKNFLKLKKRNETFYTSMNSDLIELTKATENVKKLCNRWIENKFCITDSIDNKNAFESLYRLGLDVRNTMICFEKLTQEIIKDPNFSTEDFAKKNSDLKKRIEENEKSINQMKLNGIYKLLGVDEVFDDKNSGYIETGGASLQHITFTHQEKNSSDFSYFNISVISKFYPTSFSVFEDYVFLGIRYINQYLKIFKIDFINKNHEEIKNFMINKGGNCIKSKSFGYGSKYTIIRSGSKGKMFILKSPLRIKKEKSSVTKKSFEILAVDSEFNEIVCKKVDTITTKLGYVRPAIIDFVCHNDLVYALNMKFRCLNIFNESLELLKTIPIPETLKQLKGVHLVVSSKYILIVHRTIIYYINNIDQNTEFKWVNLHGTILNIAFYDEELIIVRFRDGCYSFRIEENTSNIKYTHLPCLDKLRKLSLTCFTIKDNFVYSLCAKKHQFYRLNLTFNSVNTTI